MLKATTVLMAYLKIRQKKILSKVKTSVKTTKNAQERSISFTAYQTEGRLLRAAGKEAW